MPYNLIHALHIICLHDHFNSVPLIDFFSFEIIEFHVLQTVRHLRQTCNSITDIVAYTHSVEVNMLLFITGTKGEEEGDSLHSCTSLVSFATDSMKESMDTKARQCTGSCSATTNQFSQWKE